MWWPLIGSFLALARLALMNAESAEGGWLFSLGVSGSVKLEGLLR